MSDEIGYFRVVNIKGDPDFRPKKDETLIIMDRTHPVLGNKYPMRVTTWQERDRVIDLFNQDLEADFRSDGPMRQAILKIARDIVDNGRRVAGGCHCAGAPCHVDKIALKLNALVQELREEQELRPASLVATKGKLNL